MTKIPYYDFPDYLGYGTKEALTNYWMWGYPPGAFTRALMAGDLFRAAASADYSNKTNLADLAQWIYFYAPSGSFGSYTIVDAWLADVDGRRTAYCEKKEKLHLLKVLKATAKEHSNDAPF
jgi:hypothetical protein